MKKYTIIILALITMFFISGCNNKLKTYETINYSTFLDKIEKKEDFILLIGSYQCSACALFKETIESVIKEYQVKVYYIDIANMSEDEISKLDAKTHYGKMTPVTVFFDQGSLDTINKLEGAVSYNKVVEKFEKKGYIEVK